MERGRKSWRQKEERKRLSCKKPRFKRVKKLAPLKKFCQSGIEKARRE